MTTKEVYYCSKKENIIRFYIVSIQAEKAVGVINNRRLSLIIEHLCFVFTDKIVHFLGQND